MSTPLFLFYAAEIEEKTLRESASNEENDLIVGGTAASKGEFPFQVHN
jgi:secreted trypsin-like serine protease